MGDAGAGHEADAVGARRDEDSLTVEEVLALDVLQRAGATVSAGAASLDRPVRWVHSGEIRDISRFLRGGELLLTAGGGLGATAEEQRAYVRSISGAGVAALAVELSGRWFSELPAAAVDEAERLGLPLLALGHEIPFIEVASEVHSRIVERRMRDLVEEEEIAAHFTDLLLGGQDHIAVVDELARRTGCPAFLEDRSHQLWAYCGRRPDADPVLADWEWHSRSHHRSETTDDCTRSPVVLNGELWGWVHVRHGGAPLTRTGHYAVGRAVASVAIALLSQQVRGARRSQRHIALVTRLVLGDISGEGFVQRAMTLGQDLRGRSLLVVSAGPVPGGPPFGEAQLSDLLRAAGAVAVVVDTEASALAVVALPPRGDGAVLEALRGAPAQVGTSRAGEAGDLARAVHQAHQSHLAAAAVGSAPRLVGYDDLGVLRLLLPLADGPELARYVEDELGAVLRHDAHSENKLLLTLATFLECNGNKSEAAGRLFVQRRTLYYRLDRLAALLHADLDDPDRRFRLLLAVRGRELLKQKASHALRP